MDCRMSRIPSPATGSQQGRKSDSKVRILEAGVVEFSENGFAGTRVDQIASRAGINKQLIYYYFKNKECLYDEVLQHVHRKVEGWIEESPKDPAENFAFWLKVHSEDTTYVKLMMWEGLEGGGSNITAEEPRRAFYQKSLNELRRNRREGGWPPQLSAEHSLLSWIFLIVAPFAMPQITKLVTGLKPHDPEFLEKREAFLREFAEILKHAHSTPTNEVTIPDTNENQPFG